MKIAFLGNFSVDYSSENHHKKSLEALGHEVIPLQESQTRSEVILNQALKSDVFVWVHTHGWNTRGQFNMMRVLNTLKDRGIPTLTYHLDLWLGLEREKDLQKDPFYKHIGYFFTCDKLMADWFNENTSVKGHYLPAGVFHEDMHIDEKPETTRDVIFVGSKRYHPEWPYRPQLIEWLRSTYGNQFTHVGGDGDTGTIRGTELTDLYNSTAVSVGDSLVKNFIYPYYWSDRLYETIGRGGFIIFPKIDGIEEEFNIEDSEDQELVTYDFGDMNGLKRKIDYFIDNPDHRNKIRKNAFKKVSENYTYKHRWQEILKVVKP